MAEGEIGNMALSAAAETAFNAMKRADEVEQRLSSLRSALEGEIERLRENADREAQGTGLPGAYNDAADRLQSLLDESRKEKR